YGITSTVWLARDLRRWGWEKDRYVTIKVGVNDNAFCKTISEKEAVVSENIMKAAPNHPGFFSLRKVYGSFNIQGPTGSLSRSICKRINRRIHTLGAVVLTKANMRGFDSNLKAKVCTYFGQELWTLTSRGK
ncbi:hypothetical protein FRC12_019618, partial [Ceratobasidium sp. 428]